MPVDILCSCPLHWGQASAGRSPEGESPWRLIRSLILNPVLSASFFLGLFSDWSGQSGSATKAQPMDLFFFRVCSARD